MFQSCVYGAAEERHRLSLIVDKGFCVAAVDSPSASIVPCPAAFQSPTAPSIMTQIADDVASISGLGEKHVTGSWFREANQGLVLFAHPLIRPGPLLYPLLGYKGAPQVPHRVFVYKILF